MIGRRTLLGAILAAPVLVAGAPAARTIGVNAARREFLKILAMFNRADVPAFLAYGPPVLVDDRKPVTRDAMPAFFESLRSYNGRPDERPAWLEDDDFVHKARPAPRTVFGAAVSRSVWMEGWVDDSAHDQNMNPVRMEFDSGYYPQFEQWNVSFEGGRIVRLERWLVMS